MNRDDKNIAHFRARSRQPRAHSATYYTQVSFPIDETSFESRLDNDVNQIETPNYWCAANPLAKMGSRSMIHDCMTSAFR
jgi:hypothetical protein